MLFEPIPLNRIDQHITKCVIKWKAEGNSANAIELMSILERLRLTTNPEFPDLSE